MPSLMECFLFFKKHNVGISESLESSGACTLSNDCFLMTVCTAAYTEALCENICQTGSTGQRKCLKSPQKSLIRPECYGGDLGLKCD